MKNKRQVSLRILTSRKDDMSEQSSKNKVTNNKNKMCLHLRQTELG